MPTPHEHWRESLTELELDPAAGEPCYHGLLKRYAEAGRYYHGLAHLEALFHWFETYRSELQEPALVCLAIWYHDAIYSTLRKGNETRSATLATRQLQALGLKAEGLDKVALMIRQTADHHGPLLSEDRDLAWFLDFDLSILGTEPKVYARYAENIRKEYRLIPALIYNAGRSKILHKMLETDYLYYTPAFRRSHEKQARKNLLHEIRQLEAREVLGLD